MKGSRKKIAQSKLAMSKVLSFLLVHTYSTGDVLQKLVGYTPAGLWKLMFKMEVWGLIITQDFTIVGTHRIRVYGITLAGVHKATPANQVVNDYRRFEPSKCSLMTMQHQLDIQKLHLWAIEKGIRFYGSKDFYDSKKGAGDKRADAVLEIKGQKIAVEIERTPKTRARYAEIVANYFREIKQGQFQQVWYMMPDEASRMSIEKVITSIPSIKVRGALSVNTVQLKPEHWEYFTFIVHPYYQAKPNKPQKPATNQGGTNHVAA